MTSIRERLLGRKVVQWAVAYLTAAWVSLQVVGQLAQTFGISGAVERITFVLLAAGFLAAVVLAWYHGEKGRQRVSGTEVVLLLGVVAIGAVGVATVSGTRVAESGSLGIPGPTAVTSSIAVLPFDNLGPAEDRHFSDGVSEEILNVLAQIPDLTVAARTSAFAQPGEDATASEIARSLGVAFLLDGSVRRSSNIVRIQAQLISGDTGLGIWSDSFERELTPNNLFEIQDEISMIVARELQVRVSSAGTGAALYQTSDPEAHDLYLRGLAAFAEGTGDDLESARQLLERAVDRDPDYALAHARLAWTYAFLADAYLEPDEAYPKARVAADRALQVAPDLAEALAARGSVRMSYFPWEMEEGYTDSRRALEISPSSPWGYLGVSIYRWWRGEPAGCSPLREAHRVDPLNPLWPSWESFCQSVAGEHAAAVTAQEMATRLSSDFVYLDRFVGLSYAALGRDTEAIEQFEISERTLGRPSVGYATYLAEEGRTAAAREKLETLSDGGGLGRSAPELLAVGWVALGEEERAFEALEDGMRTRSAGALLAPVIERLRPITDTDRYRTLAAHYGLPLPDAITPPDAE
jgi:adenylate cyclase